MKGNLLRISIFIVAVMVAGFLVITNTDMEENRVTLSLMEYVKAKVRVSDVAFYSYPTTCKFQTGNEGAIDKELFENFLESNKFDRGPIRLSLLEGRVTLLTWSDNKQIYKTKGRSLKFRSSSKNLVTISRAGFNENNDQAYICLEGSYGGDIYHLVKSESNWVVKKVIYGWIT